jgi:hypothetical protein
MYLLLASQSLNLSNSVGEILGFMPPKPLIEIQNMFIIQNKWLIFIKPDIKDAS